MGASLPFASERVKIYIPTTISVPWCTSVIVFSFSVIWDRSQKNCRTQSRKRLRSKSSSPFKFESLSWSSCGTERNSSNVPRSGALVLPISSHQSAAPERFVAYDINVLLFRPLWSNQGLAEELEQDRILTRSFVLKKCVRWCHSHRSTADRRTYTQNDLSSQWTVFERSAGFPTISSFNIRGGSVRNLKAQTREAIENIVLGYLMNEGFEDDNPCFRFVRKVL